MFCLQGMVWGLPGDGCMTNEKHTVDTTLSCSSLGWLAKQEIQWLEFFNCNLLAYVYFPSQEQRSLCSEDFRLDSGSSRLVSLVLQLIHPCVVCLLILQMSHCHFPECVIKYTVFLLAGLNLLTCFQPIFHKGQKKNNMHKKLGEFALWTFNIALCFMTTIQSKVQK